jgi:plasmid stability protein
MRSLMLPALAAAALSLAGCGSLEIDPNAEGEGLFELMFNSRPLTNIVNDAQDPFDPDRRARGMLALSTTSAGGDPAYVSLYAENAEDPDPSVRAAALKALGRHGTAEHTAIMTKALTTDKDPGVRQEAARSLQRVHNPETIEPLLAAIRLPDVAKGQWEEDAEVRAQAALALAQYREQKVLQGLVSALYDPRLAVNRNALVALRTLTGQDFGYERLAWAAWIKETPNPFAGAIVFEYPAYSREKTLVEYLPFVPKPPNEPSTTPAGMPLGPVSR